MELHDPAVTVPTAVFSIILTLAALWICVITSTRTSDKNQCAASKADRDRAYVYYRNASRVASVCNVACCMSVSLYCVWIIFEPDQSVGWYITMRAFPTFFWFVAKAALIWLYNGVLFFAFKSSSFATSRVAFQAVNVLISIAVPLHLVMGFVGVFYYKPWLITLGFEGFRLEYILMTWYLLFRSVRKMLLVDAYETRCTAPEVSTGQEDQAGHHVKQDIESVMQPQKTSFFLSVATKNSVLVSVVSVCAFCVAVTWRLVDFVFGFDHLTLLVPLLGFSIDCIVTSCCIYLFFSFGQPAYNKWCRGANACFRRILVKSAEDIVSKIMNDVPADGVGDVEIHSSKRKTSSMAETEDT